MKILPVRTIENNIFTTTIKPSEFGTSAVIAEDEISMLKDFPQTLKYSDITFSDNFIVTEGNPLISSDEGAVAVTLDLNNKEYILDENFEVTLSIDASKIQSSEIDSTVLTNAQLVAQAKIILFETKVINRISTLLTNARSHVNNFEVTTEQTL